MKKYDAYLVCNDHISEVKDFLARFFKEKKDEHSSDDSVIFVTPDGNFHINLIRNYKQSLTQHVTFETSFTSNDTFERFAKENNSEIDFFLVTEAGQSYVYNYVEVLGPYNICSVKVFYRASGKILN